MIQAVHTTPFSISITSVTVISALAVGFFAPGTPSNQSSSFSHEMMPGFCRDPASLKTSIDVFASRNLWFLYSRVCSTNWHAFLFTNYHIFSTRTPPREKVACCWVWTHCWSRFSRIVQGCRWIWGFCCCYGFVRAGTIMRWNFKRLEQKALWGQRKEPWIHGKSMHSMIPDYGNLGM